MKKINILYIVLPLLMAQNLIGQEDFRMNAPAPGPAPKIELGSYEHATLDNGLQLIVVENHKIPRISFQLFVDVPTLSEGEYAGTVSLAGQLLNKGTTSMSKAEIDETIDFIGASLSSSASGLFGASLTKHKEVLLELMADVLFHPSFPEEEFNKLKTQTLSSLAQAKEDPNAIAANVANVLRYGKDHPYGELTTEQTVEKITLDECKTYYNTYFKPNISYLVVVGDISAKEAKLLAEKYFGKWEKGAVSRQDFDKPEKPGDVKMDFVGKTAAVQSVIAITYPVELKPGDPDLIKASVMNTLFGGFFGSRLNTNIREDKGFSYGVRSTLSQDREIGYFSAGGSVRNEVTDSALVEFLAEMTRLREEEVPTDELSLVKNVISGGFARSLERPETVARFALNIARYGLPEDYYATYLEKLAEVSSADIMAMAKKYLTPGNAHIVVVGNKDEVAEKLTRFADSGEVDFFDTYGNEIEMDGAAIPEGTTAETVIEDYINAIGGKEKLLGVNDINTMMTTSLQGMELEMTFQQKRPGKISISVMMNGMAVSLQKYDGEKGQLTQMGQKQDIEGTQLEDMKNQAVLFPELTYKEDGYSMELKGIEEIDAENAYRIVLSKGEKTFTEYYSVKTSLKLRSVNTQDSPAGQVTVTNDYSAYAEVDGIKFPHELTTIGVMPVPMKLKVSSIAVNKGIDDSVFSIE